MDKACFEWLPIPDALKTGAQVSVFLEEIGGAFKEIDEESILQIDENGFFIHWYSQKNKQEILIDMASLEDVELCSVENLVGANKGEERKSASGEKKMSSTLRIQIACCLSELCLYQTAGNSTDQSSEYASVNILICFLDGSVIAEVWERSLLNIGFRHRTSQEDLCVLDILRKQWTRLRLVYHAQKVHSTGMGASQGNVIIPGCCIAAALGEEGKWDQLPAVGLDKFTFDLFFTFFLQIWPREDVADLFSSFSDNRGHMNRADLTKFLQTSVSRPLQQISAMSAVRCSQTKHNDTLRKIKHINLLQWEAHHYYRTPSHSPATRAQPVSESHQQCSKSEHRVARNAERRCARIRQRTVAGSARSMSFARCYVELNEITADEFKDIVQKYECTEEGKSEGYLTVQGFYRLLVSPDYPRLTLPRAHSGTDRSQTRDHAMLHPISHYYISCAQLVSRSLDLTPAVSPQVNSHTPDKCSQNSTNFVRAVRQILLMGTRALFLNCWANVASGRENRQPGREPNADLYIEPFFIRHSQKPPTLKNCQAEDERGEDRIHSSCVQFSAPVKVVLDAIQRTVFAATDYPFILSLRLEGLSLTQQAQLALLLQQYLGEWLLKPPLPTFTPPIKGNVEKYYTRAHQPLPSPEVMKNKILLNVICVNRRATGAAPLLSSNKPPLNRSNSSEETQSITRDGVPSTMTVFVTDPEGEEKIPKQDVVSNSSSSQLSPNASRKLIRIENRTSNLRMRAHQLGEHSPYTYRNRDIGPQASGLDTSALCIDHLHPRLARLVCLPSPEPLPKLCELLFQQHQYCIAKLNKNASVNTDSQVAETSGDSRVKLRVDEQHIQPHSINQRVRQREPLDFPAGQTLGGSSAIDTSQPEVDQLEALVWLSSLLLARTVQLQHQARKRRLLKRLLLEAYGRRKPPEQGVNYGSNKTENICTSTKENIKKGQTNEKMKTIRSWFTKRANSVRRGRKQSSTSSTTDTSRRQSNVSGEKSESSGTKRTSNTGSDISNFEFRNKFENFRRRLSIRSASAFRPRSPTTSETSSRRTSSNRGRSLFSFRSSDKSAGKESPSSSSSRSSLSVQKANSRNNKGGAERIRPNSTGGNELQVVTPVREGMSKKRNASFGRCSCSSGSRSGKGSSSESESSESRKKSVRSQKNSSLKSDSVFLPAKSFDKKTDSSKPISKTNDEVRSRVKSTSAIVEGREPSTTVPQIQSPILSSSSSLSSPTDETSFSSTSSVNSLKSPQRRAGIRRTSSALCLSTGSSTSDDTFSPNSYLSFTNPRYPVLKSHLHENGNVTTGLKPSDLKNRSTTNTSERTFSVAIENSATTTEKTPFISVIPRRLLWRKTSQWIIKCKVVVTTLLQVLRLLTNKFGTKALAEYSKNRLVFIQPTQVESSWQARQLLRAVGCQLIPMDIEVPLSQMELGAISQTVAVPSVRSQMMEHYRTEYKRHQSSKPFTGYLLKPLLLRLTTSTHLHRYPKEWIYAEIPAPGNERLGSNVDEQENDGFLPHPKKWPALDCACCYDPLDWQSGYEQMRQFYQPRQFTGTVQDNTAAIENLVPWNFSIQIVGLPERYKQRMQENKLSTGCSIQTLPKPDVKRPRGLPRRYQRAATSGANPDRSLRYTPRNTFNKSMPSSCSMESFPQPLHCPSPVIRYRRHRNLSVDRPQPTERIHTLEPGSSSSQGVVIEAELQSPLIWNLTEGASAEPPRRGNNLIVPLYPCEPALKRMALNDFPHSKTTSDIHSINFTMPFDSPFEERRYLCSVPYQSCSSLHTSMPDLLTNPLGAVKAEFLRLPIPESLVISLRASHCHYTADNGPCLSVATLLCTSSPLENTLTGYQHLRLPFLKCEGGGTMQVSEKDPEISVPHPILHKSLQDCVGLVVFCKIDLNAYTPTSLGDLVDTLSKAFSSRASSLTRPQTKEGQPHPLCQEGSVASFVKPSVPRDRCKDMIMLGIDSSWIYPKHSSNSQKPQP